MTRKCRKLFSVLFCLFATNVHCAPEPVDLVTKSVFAQVRNVFSVNFLPVVVVDDFFVRFTNYQDFVNDAGVILAGEDCDVPLSSEGQFLLSNTKSGTICLVPSGNFSLTFVIEGSDGSVSGNEGILEMILSEREVITAFTTKFSFEEDTEGTILVGDSSFGRRFANSPADPTHDLYSIQVLSLPDSTYGELFTSPDQPLEIGAILSPGDVMTFIPASNQFNGAADGSSSDLASKLIGECADDVRDSVGRCPITFNYTAILGDFVSSNVAIGVISLQAQNDGNPKISRVVERDGERFVKYSAENKCSSESCFFEKSIQLSAASSSSFEIENDFGSDLFSVKVDLTTSEFVFMQVEDDGSCQKKSSIGQCLVSSLTLEGAPSVLSREIEVMQIVLTMPDQDDFKETGHSLKIELENSSDSPLEIEFNLSGSLTSTANVLTKAFVSIFVLGGIAVPSILFIIRRRAARRQAEGSNRDGQSQARTGSVRAEERNQLDFATVNPMADSEA